MNECCDPKTRLKQLTMEKFEKESEEVKKVTDSIDEKLQVLMTDAQDKASKIRGVFLAKMGNNPETEVCPHEMAKFLEPLISSTVQAFLFVELMQEYNKKNASAREVLLKILENLDKMGGGNASPVLKKFQKKKGFLNIF